jgi:hypothetical protein
MAVAHFPLHRVTDEAIERLLTGYIEQAIDANPGAGCAEVASVALRRMDPDAVSPPLVREGCRAALERPACDAFTHRRNLGGNTP